jgi:hypothetical protein
MVKWSVPTTIKSLRGFMRLTGYCKKFIWSYGMIATPLIKLLKKNSFKWFKKATEVFHKLKEAKTHPPVLWLPNFSIPFVMECDAKSISLGAYRCKRDNQLPSLVRHWKEGRALFLSTYEKELFYLVTIVQRWRLDLLGQSFKVRRDHQSLKFLLEQKAGIVLLQRWVLKLLEYDFVIECKKGKENRVVV